LFVTRLQEPTYKEMVVMYKRDPKKSVAALDPTHALATNDRGIFLRTYRNIPMVHIFAPLTYFRSDRCH
jgi:hypothetical protein